MISWLGAGSREGRDSVDRSGSRAWVDSRMGVDSWAGLDSGAGMESGTGRSRRFSIMMT